MMGPVLVVERLDHAADMVPAIVLEPDSDVPDLRPPLRELAAEPFEGRAMLVLECLERVAGPGPWYASTAGFGQDERGHDLARLDDRRVAVAQPLDPAHRVREELSSLGLDLALRITRIGHCLVLSSG
jgi:hypothetical protein